MKETPQISKSVSENESVITGTGILDLTNAGRLRELLMEAVSSSTNVVVDLTRADFIDSAVLQYLGSAGRAMQKEGRRLKVIVAEGGHPHYVLKTVGFGALMTIEAEPV